MLGIHTLKTLSSQKKITIYYSIILKIYVRAFDFLIFFRLLYKAIKNDTQLLFNRDNGKNMEDNVHFRHSALFSIASFNYFIQCIITVV